MIKKLIHRLFAPRVRHEHTAQPRPRSLARRLTGRLLNRHVPPPRGPAKVGASEHHIDPHLVSNHATRVTHTLQNAGYQAFLVGGAVRDLMLGIKPKDFDVATNATPEEIQRLFRRARIIGRRFQLVHVMFGNETIEVSTFRANLPLGADKDAHGRVLRDNVFGSQEDDAARRDFTVNALFYDPATQTVIDYHHGVADLKKRLMRMIGDPEQRYREDPVRMLRAVRLAAKLGFEIDTATAEPIARLAPFIENVPAARLFDEMIKLMFSGHAVEALQRLRAVGLHHGLFPLLDVVLEQPMGERFVTLALESTDERVRQGKTTSPSFLFACLLWQEVLKAWQEGVRLGGLSIPTLNEAMDRVLDQQTEKLAIQRRFVSDMREIWGMQPRLERRSPRTAHKLLEHLRFRAAYDFLLLRCAAGECEAELGTWWTDFLEADPIARELLLQNIAASAGPATARRKRRRRKPSEGIAGDEAGTTAAPGPQDSGTTS